MNVPQLTLDRLANNVEDFRCGQAVSTSWNALIIRFVGGPWDGCQGMYDFEYDQIGISSGRLRRTYEYRRVSRGVYGLFRTYDWGC